MNIPTTYSNISSAQGDATNLLEYKDNEYDIVFSNSVIEHLYTLEAQKKMSEEVQRVGKKHFIQTPNKHFIIEAHYILPLFQYLPKKLQYPILTLTPLSRGRRWDKAFARQYVDEIRLLSLREMNALFPESQIYKEKFMGMTKSITAHNFHP
jgi:predicted SAM-dependent methyltransferase